MPAGGVDGAIPTVEVAAAPSVDAGIACATEGAGPGASLSLLQAPSLLTSGGTSTEALIQLAQQQASRDAQVTAVRRELSEAHAQLATAVEVEASLRERLRDGEMSDKRASASSEYIKCIVLKLLHTDESEHAALFPVLATCLQFSETDVQSLIDAREARRTRGGLLSSLVGRKRAPVGAPEIDKASAEMALELASKAQILSRQSDTVAIRTLVDQIGALDDHLSECTRLYEAAQLASVTKVDEIMASMTEQDRARHELDEARKAEDGTRLYIRNVLLRYMENEDHETMFPVIATCMRFTPEEVSGIHDRRAEREKRRGWRLFG